MKNKSVQILTLFAILMFSTHLAFARMSIRMNDETFNNKKEAVVKLKIKEGGQLSGFFISDDGYILTSSFKEFELLEQKNDMTIETASGFSFKAQFIADNPKLGFTIVKADVKTKHYLTFSQAIPKEDDRLFIIGSTGEKEMKQNSVIVDSVNNKTIVFSRDGKMLGFSGAPLLTSKKYEVIGIHRGSAIAVDGKRIDKKGEAVRIEGINSYLSSLGIMVAGSTFR